MKIFSLFKEYNKIEVVVHDSLEDFTNRTEWQDILDNYFIIIDKYGNIYNWDDSKKEEFSTIYQFSLKISKIDLDLGKMCYDNYVLNNFKTEFNFEI